MSDIRLVLFIDWQNSYMTVRDAFSLRTTFHTNGQVDPWDLGLRIAGKHVERVPRVLFQVRVYRGAPDPRKDSKGAAAQQRQAASWERRGAIVKRRALRYPSDWPASKAEEKGIDVQLAVDLVAGHLRSEFDVAVVLSRDTDLVPALELACEIAKQQKVLLPEVASWARERGEGPRLRVKGLDLRCHWLTRADYDAVKDNTDYNIRQN